MLAAFRISLETLGSHQDKFGQIPFQIRLAANRLHYSGAALGNPPGSTRQMTTEARLADFVAAQDAVYDEVLRELAAGRKETHWIWFIFPQITGLGFSEMARRFGITSLTEAQSYLKHEVLGTRLRECTELMLASPHRGISAILGYPDDLKFRSSMTLFAAAAPEESLFEAALEKFFGGEHDALTIRLLGLANGPG